ncbi:hypothetical protein PTTG_26428 [Puccinia triticina 1-1 BBBD Race 1]|uniref:Uncharacterized protein n=2 Tax=Puccinia triticina TaxID=208348 RepID=A0A180GVC3_PUCT1|nr:uncharacterized protein PtA15_7A745 [Puccinia triticina]OAV96242.1 hypothetical protein PTTG_26428 [Puccinia triticina 1-1 BBBD Race 1]WAQ87016.1 hypothetical protein PtA15_7A745 [Puccinia triticina]WAR56871.1 hypothetical protein PtB15_7B723 [Puccinia triticina]
MQASGLQFPPFELVARSTLKVPKKIFFKKFELGFDALRKYAIDLTEMARENLVDPNFVPPYQEQPSPLGEPGVGKTAIAKGDVKQRCTCILDCTTICSRPGYYSSRHKLQGPVSARELIGSLSAYTPLLTANAILFYHAVPPREHSTSLKLHILPAEQCHLKISLQELPEDKTKPLCHPKFCELSLARLKRVY